MRPKGSPDVLEARRRQAVAWLEQGYTGAQVARMLGVSPGAVCQWKQVWARAGPEGLAAKPHPGPQPKLTCGQGERLGRLLLRGPCRAGYSTEWWTLSRVAEVIRRHFGVTYDPSGVWHLLSRMGWSCQKPERRARERNDEEIERWRRAKWPRIKKSPAGRPKPRFPR